MNLTIQLLKDIRDKEMDLNDRECKVIYKRAQRILINNEVFKKLIAECSEYIELNIKDGNIRFTGIPVARTKDIEKWEIWG